MSKIGKLTGALALTAALGAGLAGPAAAEEGVRGKQAGDFVIGLSAIGVLPQNAGRGGRVDTINPAAGKAEVRASNAATGQLDFTYFINRNISLNLIAATTEHELTVKNTALGNLNLGKIWALPPTLTLQYHPLPDSRISPYVGAGLNYTFFYGYDSGSRTAGLRNTSVDNSVGFALNVGLDYEVTPNWLVNVDVKQLFLTPNVNVGTALGVKVHGRADLNPLIIGAGVRYRFSL